MRQEVLFIMRNMQQGKTVQRSMVSLAEMLNLLCRMIRLYQVMDMALFMLRMKCLPDLLYSIRAEKMKLI